MNALILRQILYAHLVLFFGMVFQGFAQQLPFSTTGKPIDHSLRREVARTIDRGNQWLLDHQDAEGFWSASDQPYVTAYALMALKRDPEEHHANVKDAAFEDGFRYLNSCIQANGGIYIREARSLLDTSSSLLALLMNPQELQIETVNKARAFLVSEMEALMRKVRDHDEDVPFSASEQVAESQFMSVMQTIEALRFSQQFSELSKEDFLDIHRDSILSFLVRYQYLASDSENQSLANLEGFNGGFVSHFMNQQNPPLDLKGKLATIKPAGSYSFDGLLAYLYLGVDFSDQRAKAVQAWLNRHYSLNQNPGLGERNLFYYFQSMAKTWTALKMGGTTTHLMSHEGWRHELALHLMNLQQADGSWVNKGKVGFEQDSVLATSYALIALEIIYSGL